MDTVAKSFAKKFLEELKKESVNEETFLTEWEYAGGPLNPQSDDNSRYEYFCMKFPAHKRPKTHPCDGFCICNHWIEDVCYIYNIINKKVLNVGNCCVKRFIPHSGKTCAICSAKHKRRISNVCKKCDPVADNIFTFGKHKYKTFAQVLKDDPQYLRWLSTQTWVKNELLIFLGLCKPTLERLYGQGIVKVNEPPKKEPPKVQYDCHMCNNYDPHCVMCKITKEEAEEQDDISKRFNNQADLTTKRDITSFFKVLPDRK